VARIDPRRSAPISVPHAADASSVDSPSSTAVFVPDLAGSTAASTSASEPGSSASMVPTVPSVVAPRTRLQGGIQKPKVYTDGTVRYACLTSSGEPYSLQEAMSTPHWMEAMANEYHALICNKTWRLVPPRNLIDCK
jgi:hypothetical protein